MAELSFLSVCFCLSPVISKWTQFPGFHNLWDEWRGQRGRARSDVTVPGRRNHDGVPLLPPQGFCCRKEGNVLACKCPWTHQRRFQTWRERAQTFWKVFLSMLRFLFSTVKHCEMQRTQCKLSPCVCNANTVKYCCVHFCLLILFSRTSNLPTD